MRIFFTLLLSFIFYSAFSQTIYKFRLDEIDNLSEAKEASGSLYSLFDKMPLFDDESDTFFVRSITDISKENFEMKCADLGYSLMYFLKNEATAEEYQP